MVKSQNPLDQHRRALRKKELAKNKSKRITARDAKVAATLTVSVVQKEINDLTRKKNFQEGHLDSKDTKRLERLHKELKIVRAEDVKRKAERDELERAERKEREKHAQSKQGIEERNESIFGAHAKSSIYYDAVLNPYGAPPPGKPMMYWDQSGGMTMDVRKAVVPDSLQSDKGQTNRSAADAVAAVPAAAESIADDKVWEEKKRRQRQWDDEGDAKVSRTDTVSGAKDVANNVDEEKMKEMKKMEKNEPTHSTQNIMYNNPPPLQQQHQNYRNGNTTSLPPAHPPHSSYRGGNTHTIPPPPPPPPPPLPPPPPSQHIQGLSSSLQPPPPPPPFPPHPSHLLAPPPPLPPPPLPKEAPLPPPPSKAVQRIAKKSKSKSLLADIWASNEELHYDTNNNMEGVIEQQNQPQHASWVRRRNDSNKVATYDPLCPSTEGYAEYRSQEQISRAASTKNKDQRQNHRQKRNENIIQQKTELKESMWYYKDQSSNIQGPYGRLQMKQWKDAGFFPLETTLVRCDAIALSGHTQMAVGTFVPLRVCVDYLDGIAAVQNQPSIAQQETEGGLLPEKDGDVEARIAALKGERVSAASSSSMKPQVETKDIDAGDCEDGDIGNNAAVNQEDREGQTSTSSLEDRIAALRADRLKKASQVVAADVDEPSTTSKNTIGEPHYEQDSEENGKDVDSLHQGMDIEQNPAQYPTQQEGVKDPVAQYLVAKNETLLHPTIKEDSDLAVSVYPLGDDIGGNEDDEVDIAYPTDVAYPASDEYGAYPDTDVLYGSANAETDAEVPNYPIPEDLNYSKASNSDYAPPSGVDLYATSAETYAPLPPYEVAEEGGENVKTNVPKKKYTGDKAVVGFVPSHIQVKRSNHSLESKKKRKLNVTKGGGIINNYVDHSMPQTVTERTATKKKQGDAASKPTISVTDDYEQFMEEINALK